MAIGMLESGLASKIAIADKDPLIAAFWEVVFSARATSLAELILETPVTLDAWRKQRLARPRGKLKQAFKCLFLSRTSFSGCLTDATGPIGGYQQTGEYKIDCRFNRSRIASRILELSKLRDRVEFVRCQSWQMTMKHIAARAIYRDRPKAVLCYFDPPFFAKASSLYRHFFETKHHLELASWLPTIRANYILSYDDHPDAWSLYSKNPGVARVNLQYNARVDDDQRLVASEILVSNLIGTLRERRLLGSIGCVIPLPHRRKKTVIHQELRVKQQQLCANG